MTKIEEKKFLFVFSIFFKYMYIHYLYRKLEKSIMIVIAISTPPEK